MFFPLFFKLSDFWSLDGVDGPLDSPPFVRTYVPIFPKIRALEFSDFLVSRRSRFRPKESRLSVRACVRTYVRKYLRAC